MIGTRLANRYELLEKLGAGGMGVVYRARDPYLDRDVAVKMVPPWRLDEESEERFRREAQLVARMDHPAIVPIHDFGRTEESLFFVMPLVEGKTLKELAEERALTTEEIVEVAAEAAEGLAHAHDRDVIHRDVKPANIMVSKENGEVRTRVMDFGLARGTHDGSQTGGMMGTPAYLAPEQVKGLTPEARTDLYALGAVVYECLCGEPPFDGPLASVIYRIGHEAPLPLSERSASVDPELEHIVSKCLEKDPSDRPADGRSLAAAFRAWLESRRAPASERHGDSGRRRSEDAGRQRPPAPELLLPLVGRESEWSRIRERFEAAWDGQGQLVLVGGEAGVGKSRMLYELETLASERRVRLLRGRYSDLEQSFHYEGICDLVQDYFRGLDPRRGAPDLSDLAPELLALFPVLSEIPELRRQAPAPSQAPHGVAGTPSVLASTGATYVFELLARTLIRLGEGEPLVLLVENLHEANASIEALRYLVHRLAPTPILIVGTYRPAQAGPGHPLLRWIKNLRDHPRVLNLVLAPLRKGAFRQLAELWAGSRRLGGELVDRLYEATEGNALFARELIRSLLETGSLVADPVGSLALTGEAAFTAGSRLPSTLQQAVERRLELLSDELRSVLEVAAVLGKGFHARDLEAMLARGEQVDLAIDQAIEHGILREDDKARGDRLVFVSGLVRTVLYNDLSRRKRRALHRHYARYLEERAAGRLERFYPALVRHYSAGDVPAKTLGYALAQARRSLAAWNPEDAVRAVRIALEFVEEDEIEEPERARGELAALLARAHRILGQNAQAFDEAARAVAAFEEAGETGPAARAAWIATQAAWQGRRIEETRLWVDRTAELARTAGTAELLVRVLLLGSTVANLRGESELARSYREEAGLVASEPGPAAQEPGSIPAGGTLHVALPIAIEQLDPAEIDSDENAEVVGTVFESLLRVDAEGNLLPALATDWRASEGGRRFELTLERGVRFSDGHELVAPDVRHSFERLARHRTEAPPSALAALAGRESFLAGETDSLAGVEVSENAPYRVTFRLAEPLPIFPVLLTDLYSAIARETADRRVLGTGPFELEVLEPERTLLRRNPHFRGGPPRLDHVEFRTALDASRIAEDLTTGRLDVGRDLLLGDLEELLRSPRFRGGLVESARKNVHFLLWNLEGPLARHREVRRALAGILDPSDLVWRTLGRFALPAVCLVPPGLLGHDPGRRRRQLTLEEARGILRRARLEHPIRIRAVAHPVILNRGRDLLRALFEVWSALGVEIELAELTIDGYLETYRANREVDLLIGRWNADYDDPDSFAYSLFHSRHGVLRCYYSSQEGDRLLERARGQIAAPERAAVYQSFERLLEDEDACVPLFHDVSYRLAGPQVRGLVLENVAPFVNYGELGKEEREAGAAPAQARAEGGEIHVPIVAPLACLDPVGDTFAEHLEVVSTIYESLTRLDESAGVVPWLAQTLESSADARTYRLRLRRDVRFHDGRWLTARDVRYSFERALTRPETSLRSLLLPIRGARALSEGRARHLAGLEIRSTHEITIELEEPIPFFAALLSHPAAGIVAEGSEAFTASWRGGSVGTGPFRVLRFEKGGDVELERHPEYWRPGRPSIERLTFHCGQDARQVVGDFRAGKFSLVSDLDPADIEALRRDPELAGGCLEVPRLSTLFLVLNRRRGPLAHDRVRRCLARALDFEALFREAIGPRAEPARGLIPPGLVGHEAPRTVSGSHPDLSLLEGLRLEMAVIPRYFGPYSSVWEELRRELTRLGIDADVHEAPVSKLAQTAHEGMPDVLCFRWLADYPDPDAFASALFHSRHGILSAMCGHAELDRLCERGRRELDPSLRHAAYRDLEEYLVREALVVPLLHEQSYRFHQPSIEGVRAYFALPEIRYEEIRVRG